MSTARFPEGAALPIEESMAKHAQVGDVIAVADPVVLAHRIGVVSRRVWLEDGTIRLDMTDYPAPIT